MIRINRKLLAGVALSGLLAACSGGVKAPETPPVAAPAPPPTGLQNQFGAAFSALFSASADVEATEPAAAAVPQQDLTTEAVAG